MAPTWTLTKLSSPYRGEWRYLEMQSETGEVCVLRLFLSGKNRWRWEWEERWLGKATRIVARTAFRRRREAVNDLCWHLIWLGWRELAEGVHAFEWTQGEENGEEQGWL